MGGAGYIVSLTIYSTNNSGTVGRRRLIQDTDTRAFGCTSLAGPLFLGVYKRCTSCKAAAGWAAIRVNAMPHMLITTTMPPPPSPALPSPSPSTPRRSHNKTTLLIKLIS